MKYRNQKSMIRGLSRRALSLLLAMLMLCFALPCTTIAEESIGEAQSNELSVEYAEGDAAKEDALDEGESVVESQVDEPAPEVGSVELYAGMAEATGAEAPTGSEQAPAEEPSAEQTPAPSGEEPSEAEPSAEEPDTGEPSETKPSAEESDTGEPSEAESSAEEVPTGEEADEEAEKAPEDVADKEGKPEKPASTTDGPTNRALPLPALTNAMDDAERLLAVAFSQVGYQECGTNFKIQSDGKVQGWTCYGAWYGMPYEEWCAMFVSWCLEKAGISARAFPRSANCQRWKEALGARYIDDEDGYLPRPGDIIFFHHNRANSSHEPNYPNHVGIVSGCDGISVYTVEGNSAKSVRERSYPLASDTIVGFVNLRVALGIEKAPPEEAPEPAEENGAASAEWDETHTVEFDGLYYDSLDAALVAAHEAGGGTVALHGDAALPRVEDDTACLILTEAITLAGNRYTVRIDPSRRFSLFGDVTLMDVTLDCAADVSDALHPIAGGDALFTVAKGATLTLRNATVQGRHLGVKPVQAAWSDAGEYVIAPTAQFSVGFYVEGRLALRNSRIVDLRDESREGTARGAAIYVAERGVLSMIGGGIENCGFDPDQDFDSFGGAIYADADTAVTLRNARIVGNTARYGAAIAARDTAILSIQGVESMDNRAAEAAEDTVFTVKEDA